MDNRRNFIKKMVGTSALLLPINNLLSMNMEESTKKVQPNDKIRFACIGAGIMGQKNIETVLKIQGIEFVAVCDLYNGRIERTKEKFGNHIFSTKDYLEILDKKDVDAVIIATPDHWHQKIAIDAMRKGKAVYCEKPMVQNIDEGKELIHIANETKAVFQVGSQRVSSIAYKMAKDYYQKGTIGQLVSVESTIDRQVSTGAWQYSMPLDANTNTIDWNRFIANRTKVDFDPKRFFWWRNYKEYGTGIPGDLFVHLLSGIHFMTDSLGPSKIYATGQLKYWKDGRNVPDTFNAILSYPETKNHTSFQILLRVNLVSGLGFEEIKTTFIGTEGYFDFGWNDFKIKRNKLPKAPHYGGWDSFDTFTDKMQKEFVEDYNKKYNSQDRIIEKFEEINFNAPKEYDDRYDHFVNFVDSIRNNKKVYEDASFGFRAAAPCLACNISNENNKIVLWNPEKMELV